jgi:hypothetical protein
MTLANVSMILPLQNGHIVGRVTASDSESGMLLYLFYSNVGLHDPMLVCMTHAGGFLPLRLFKSEQPSRVGFPNDHRTAIAAAVTRFRRVVANDHVVVDT